MLIISIPGTSETAIASASPILPLKSSIFSNRITVASLRINYVMGSVLESWLEFFLSLLFSISRTSCSLNALPIATWWIINTEANA